MAPRINNVVVKTHCSWLQESIMLLSRHIVHGSKNQIHSKQIKLGLEQNWRNDCDFLAYSYEPLQSIGALLLEHSILQISLESKVSLFTLSAVVVLTVVVC